MKKILAVFSAILLASALSLSVMAFRDDEPKKQKTECTADKQCDKQADQTACTKNEASSSCKKSSGEVSESPAKKDDTAADIK